MWLYAPSHSAPAKVDWNSDSTSRVLAALAPHCTWNGNSTRLASLRLACKREAFLLRLSGLTSVQSVLQKSAESWAASTASRADTPASRSPVPAAVVAKMIRGIYGLQSMTRLASISRACVFSRTSQATLLSDSIPFSLIYERWATELRRTSLRRRKCLAAHTGGNGCSSWPTAAVPNGGRTSNTSNYREDGSKQQVDLGALATQWTTPQAHDVTARGSGQKPCSAAGNACLATDAKLWQTPQEPKGGGTSRSGDRKDEPLLDGQARMWQTPSDPTYKYRRQVGQAERAEELLPAQAENFPSSLPAPATEPPGQPCSQDGQDSPPPSWQDRESWATPQETDSRGMTTSRKAQTETRSRSAPRLQDQIGKKKRLNPNFVDWLMGFPIGHSDSDSTVTPQYRNAWRQLSSLCLRHWLARVTET